MKYDADVGFDKRLAVYDGMIDKLTELSRCETSYKITVDEANNCIVDFRREMLRSIKRLRDLEEPRSQTVHSVLN